MRIVTDTHNEGKEEFLISEKGKSFKAMQMITTTMMMKMMMTTKVVYTASNV